MKKTIIILFVILVIDCSGWQRTFADENYRYAVGVAPICFHTGDNENYNEKSDAVFLYYDNWTLGTFRNSIGQQSIFGGYKWSTRKVHPVGPVFARLNLYVGLLHGYGNRLINVHHIAPMAMPTAEFGVNHYSIEIMANMAVVSVLLKYSF